MLRPPLNVPIVPVSTLCARAYASAGGPMMNLVVERTSHLSGAITRRAFHGELQVVVVVAAALACGAHQRGGDILTTK